MKTWLVPLVLAATLGAACGGSNGEDEAIPTGTPSATGAGQPAETVAAQSLPGNWITDFSETSISFDDLTRGQSKDGIPAIDEPQFLPVSDVDFLGDTEPVVSFIAGNEARAYPLQIMTWHEIVNDVVDGRPVLITFCPLCNTAIAFDRVVDGQTLAFGVSGFLRNSDLVMFDRTTESFWQQITGEALIGEFTGTRLESLPASIVSWADFRDTFPSGQVLSRETGFFRTYGDNPYVGYDDINSSPFLFDGEADGRLSAMERVATVELGDEVVAYPFSRLEANPVVNDTVGGQDIAIFFKLGTTSALDQESIADSRDVGTATVYSSELDGQKLTFTANENGFTDAETNSTWDIFGRATTGPLEGQSLEPIVNGNHFWFAWAAFQPDTRVWDGT